jgi:8-oxo-dGTP pyrophosphatase MutT (NUDIX family)
MAHIHKKIDFTIVAYIVHKNKVLLIHHKKLGRWLPLGGHIELDENPDQALFREIKEECGLSEKDLIVNDTRPKIESKGIEFLLTPQYMDIHKIDQDHKHIGIVYFIKSKNDEVHLSEEHDAIRWLSFEDIRNIETSPAIRFYAEEALKTLGSK